MNAPTFWYSPVERNDKDMSDELQRLGGGDAIVSQAQVHCFIDPSTEEKPRRTVWKVGEVLGLRDIQFPMDSPAEKSMKYFNVSNTHEIDKIPIDEDGLPFVPAFSDCVKSLSNGFNVCMIAFGERGTRKSSCCFGALGLASSLSSPEDSALQGGFFSYIMRELFRETAEVVNRSHETRTVSISLSAWTLRNQRVVDLLGSLDVSKSSHTSNSPLDFALVEVSDVATATAILAIARSRAPGVLAGAGERDGLREHFFVRVTLHMGYRNRGDDSDTGTISQLYMSDLVGSVNTEDRVFSEMDEQWKIYARESSLQLQAFHKVLHELGQLSRQASELETDGCREQSVANAVRITCARDSKLTVILAPIIQGNCRIVLLPFVRDGAASYPLTRSTLLAVKDSLHISSAVYKVRDVSLQALDIRPASSVLSMLALRGSTRTSLTTTVQELRRDDVKGTCDNQLDVSVDDANIDIFAVAKRDYRRGHDERKVRDQSSVPELAQSVVSAKAEIIMAEFHELMADMQRRFVPLSAFAAPYSSPLPIIDDGTSSVAKRYVEKIGHVGYTDFSDVIIGKKECEIEAPYTDTLIDAVEDAKIEASHSELTLIENEIDELRRMQSDDAENQANDEDVLDSLLPPRSVSPSEPSFATRKVRSRGIVPKQGGRDARPAPMPSSIPEIRLADESQPLPMSHITATLPAGAQSLQGSLLDALASERLRSEKVERMLLALQERETELRIECDAAMDGYKVEILRLRNQVRVLTTNNSISDIFATFEEEVSRLVKENAALRKRNLLLESREEGLGLSQLTVSRSSSDSAAVGATQGQVLNDRYKRLLSQMNKVKNENEMLLRDKEELMRQSRHNLLSTKVADDARKWLSVTHEELQQTRAQLQDVQAAHEAAVRDLKLVTEEAAEVRVAERKLREERARFITELASLRARVQDFETEHKRKDHAIKFISKHVPDGSTVPSRQSPASRIGDSVLGVSISGTEERAIPGVAGLRDAQYIRPEEHSALSEGLETALSVLHEGILESCPKLLPAHRRVCEEAHSERTRMLLARSKLVGMLYSDGGNKANPFANINNIKMKKINKVDEEERSFNPDTKPAFLDFPETKQVDNGRRKAASGYTVNRGGHGISFI